MHVLFPCNEPYIRATPPLPNRLTECRLMGSPMVDSRWAPTPAKGSPDWVLLQAKPDVHRHTTPETFRHRSTWFGHIERRLMGSPMVDSRCVRRSGSRLTRFSPGHRSYPNYLTRRIYRLNNTPVPSALWILPLPRTRPGPGCTRYR